MSRGEYIGCALVTLFIVLITWTVYYNVQNSINWQVYCAQKDAIAVQVDDIWRCARIVK